MITEFKSQELKKQRLEFLEEMVDFYTKNPEKRGLGFSIETGTVCRYRGHNGRMCAIGRYITDEKYTEDIENITVKDNRVMDCLPMHIQNLGREFLADVQDLHDYNHWDFKKPTHKKQLNANIERIKKAINNNLYEKIYKEVINTLLALAFMALATGIMYGLHYVIGA